LGSGIRTRLRDREKFATHEALGFAALRLAVERGLDDVLVEDIAAAAGVSTRTFNNYGADTAALLTYLSDQPAYVLSSSSGANVAVELLSKYPELINTVVVHEPPLATLLPDADEWLAFLDGIRKQSHTEGTLVAMATFSAAIGLQMPLRPPVEELPPDFPAMFARIQQNLQFWMEHELSRYPRYTLDIAALRDAAAKLVLTVGHDSKDTLPGRPNVVLADRLGLDVVEFPGNHAGYVTAADGFSAQLAGLLASRTGAPTP
jgi:pimeloyl-ACP methyl ester carboxylesterase